MKCGLTGHYGTTTVASEAVYAFVPAAPPLERTGSR